MSVRWYRGNVDDPVLVADVGPLLRVVVLPGGGLQPQRARGEETLQRRVRVEAVQVGLLHCGTVHMLHSFVIVIQLKKGEKFWRK